MSILTIDINGKCNNLDCEFCYQSLDGSQLSVDEIAEYIKSKTKVPVVEIGGGEPLLHRDLFDIMSMIAESGKRVHISTNATFIPEGMLDLEDAVRDTTTIQVSLHAGNPELYKEITGRNLFDNVVGNTAAFNERYQTLLSAAIYQKNVGNVPEIVAVADALGVPLRVNLVMPIGKGRDVQLINETQLQELRSYLFQEKLGGKRIDSPLLHFNNCVAMQEAYRINKVGQCPLDCGKEYVSPRGEVTACEFVRGAA